MSQEAPVSGPTVVETPQQQEPGFRSLRRDLRRGLVLTTVLLTLVSTGVQAAIIKLFQLDDALTLFGTFARTAPLTLALTISVILWILVVGGEVAEGGLKNGFVIGFVVTGFLLWLAMVVGNALGGLEVTMPDIERAYLPMREGGTWPVQDPMLAIKNLFLVRAIRGYYNGYGPAAFWSSVILAGFMVFAFFRMLGAYLEQQEARRAGTAPPQQPPN